MFFGWKKVGIAPWVETTRAALSFSNVTGDFTFLISECDAPGGAATFRRSGAPGKGV
jgi:hypothetical protein